MKHPRPWKYHPETETITDADGHLIQWDDDAIREINRSHAAWVPCTEVMPLSGPPTLYLIHTSSSEACHQAVDVAWYENEGDWSGTPITHFAPLPPPPDGL